MKTTALLLMASIVFVSFRSVSDFKSEQLKNSRVKEAFEQKETLVSQLLKNKEIHSGSLQIFIRAFKKEQIVELWGKNTADTKFKLIKTYPFCTSSGTLGPKRRQGDYQIPEGFYYIDRFNPWSSFHLSLGINYPNQSDKILGYTANLGGDIFIHGNCVTIGCIPITDDKIKELYVFAVEAKNNGQTKIPVHIFPSQLTTEGLQALQTEYSNDNKLTTFWSNLQQGYAKFESNLELPKVTVASSGKYIFK